MAKVPFSKLQAAVDGCTVSPFYYNRAGEEIHYEVKHYLPMAEKMEMISKVINQSIDENGFYNPMRVKVFLTLEIVYYYTNLSFTDKMKEDPCKLFDLLVSTGIFMDVVSCLGDHEFAEIKEDVWATIDNIYKYKNSAMGILDTISSDYSNLDLDATSIKEKIGNPENMAFLKDVLSKLG